MMDILIRLLILMGALILDIVLLMNYLPKNSHLVQDQKDGMPALVAQCEMLMM